MENPSKIDALSVSAVMEGSHSVVGTPNTCMVTQRQRTTTMRQVRMRILEPFMPTMCPHERKRAVI